MRGGKSAWRNWVKVVGRMRKTVCVCGEAKRAPYVGISICGVRREPKGAKPGTGIWIWGCAGGDRPRNPCGEGVGPGIFEHRS